MPTKADYYKLPKVEFIAILNQIALIVPSLPNEVVTGYMYVVAYSHF